MILLESLHRDVGRAVALLTASSPGQAGSTSPHAASTFASTSSAHGLRRSSLVQHHSASSHDDNLSSPDAIDEEGAEEEETRHGFETVIESPLAVLAHLSSLKLSGTNDEETGTSFLPSGAQSQTAPEQYFATG